MTKTSDFDDERVPPRRIIGKQEAIRHLLYSAVRLVMKDEDPFAARLIVHSADKMILDIAKSRGEHPRVDWEIYIKDEYHKEFFTRHRETYNYFKHAKNDFDAESPVHDIMMLNVYDTIHRCGELYGSFQRHTDHMMLFNVFVMNLSSAIIGQNFPNWEEMLKNIATSLTPRDVFRELEQNQSMLPPFGRELSDDLQDIIDFYKLSFSERRAGKTKSPRLFKLPGMQEPHPLARPLHSQVLVSGVCRL
jgi:hypothetical protein